MLASVTTRLGACLLWVGIASCTDAPREPSVALIARSAKIPFRPNVRAFLSLSGTRQESHFAHLAPVDAIDVALAEFYREPPSAIRARQAIDLFHYQAIQLVTTRMEEADNDDDRFLVLLFLEEAAVKKVQIRDNDVQRCERAVEQSKDDRLRTKGSEVLKRLRERKGRWGGLRLHGVPEKR